MNQKKNALSIATLAMAFAMPALSWGQCTINVGLDITAPDCGEVGNGSVTMTASGGVEPYTYYWNGNVSSPTVTGLSAGTYDYWAEDWAKCWFKGSLELECEEEVNCIFRTQTMGGWGATPNGNNPAMYLQNHWTACFPNGITVGCASNHTLTLTSSTAVKNFLPSGSTASMLPSDKVNPGGTYNNVLAGQLVAAVINVTVDACDPDFSQATGWLGDVSYVGGPFAGMSISEVIEAANQFIGGCGSAYTANNFNVALTQFNENYLSGTVDNGYFHCQKIENKMMIGGSTGKSAAYPNPTSDLFTMQVDLQNAGSGTLFVHDVTGRVVLQQAVLATEAGNRKLVVNVADLSNGTYTVALIFNGQVTTSRIAVSK